MRRMLVRLLIIMTLRRERSHEIVRGLRHARGEDVTRVVRLNILDGRAVVVGAAFRSGGESPPGDVGSTDAPAEEGVPLYRGELTRGL